MWLACLLDCEFSALLLKFDVPVSYYTLPNVLLHKNSIKKPEHAACICFELSNSESLPERGDNSALFIYSICFQRHLYIILQSIFHIKICRHCLSERIWFSFRLSVQLISFSRDTIPSTICQWSKITHYQLRNIRAVASITASGLRSISVNHGKDLKKI